MTSSPSYGVTARSMPRSRSESTRLSWGPSMSMIRSRTQSWSLSRARPGSFHVNKSVDLESERPILLKMDKRIDKALAEPEKSCKILLLDRHAESAPVTPAGVCGGANKVVQDRVIAASYPKPALGASEKAWFQCCMSQSIREMEKVLQDFDGIIDRRDYFNGFTALHWAAKFNNRDMLSLCLRRRANLDQRSHGGDTPLHIASRHGYPDICIALINSGADANVRNNRGQTAFQIAHKRIPDHVREKLKKPAKTNTANDSGSNLIKRPEAGKRPASKSVEEHPASHASSRSGNKGGGGSWFRRKSQPTHLATPITVTLS